MMTCYKKTNVPIILFGDFIAAYGVIRALGPLDIPIFLVSPHSKNNLCRYSKYVRGNIVISPNREGYFEKLITWGKRSVGEEAVLIIAGADEPLDILPAYLPELPVGWKPTFPNAPIVKLVRQKALTYRIAQTHNIPIPSTFAIDSPETLEKVLAFQEIKLPALLKSELSSEMLKRFNTKGVIAENIDQIRTYYEEYDHFFGKLLLQEMIPGGEEKLYCLKAVLDNDGNTLAWFMDRKVRSSRQFSSCTLTVSIFNDVVFRQGRNLLKQIGYQGYASVEFKLDDRDNLFKLMEINGRVSMNNSHALKCGVNLPLTMYNNVLGLPSSSMSLDPRKLTEKKILWWFPFGEISLIATSIKERKFSLANYISELKGDGYIIEPFCLRDPLPGIYLLLRTLGTIAKNITNLIVVKLFSRKNKP